MNGSHKGFAGFALPPPGALLGCVQANIAYRQIHWIMNLLKMLFDPGVVPEFFSQTDSPNIN